MDNINKGLISRWYQKSQKEGKEGDDVFDRFISLWIAFNAYYAGNNLSESEYKQLDLFQSANKVLFYSIVEENLTEFEKFKKYIETKPQNTGFIQDLRYPVGDEKNRKRYQNLKSLCEYRDCIYQIRCNLFHGGKDIADAQDQELVKFALSTLSIFLKKVFEKKIC